MGQGPKWSKAHDHLRVAMEKEVDVLRELLANLFQEEVVLMKRNSRALTSLKEDRSKLLHTLSSLRKERLFATKQIKELASAPHDSKKVELEHFLPQGDANTSDLLTLRQQIRALHDKMHVQKIRNHYLTQEAAYLKMQPQVLPKKKCSIATYEETP